MKGKTIYVIHIEHNDGEINWTSVSGECFTDYDKAKQASDKMKTEDCNLFFTVCQTTLVGVE